MQLSIHYYVLALSEQRIRLFEGFRESLIEIHNTRFPFVNSHSIYESITARYSAEQLRDFLSKSDNHLAHYFNQDPLWIIILGEQKHLALFDTLTMHHHALIRRLTGEYGAMSSFNLGRIVWPVMKKVLAGTDGHAIQDLEMAVDSGRIIMGLDAVASSLESNEAYSLFLEEDYHVRGGNSLSAPLANEAIDDVVDIQVDRVLAKGGNVVFMDSGSMIKYQRIALIPPMQSIDASSVTG